MDEEIKNSAEEKEEIEVNAEIGAEADAPEVNSETDTPEENVGNVKISAEVVSTIAGIATTEIKGVAGMYGTLAGGIAEMLGAKKNPAKGVKVDLSDGSVSIDLYIIVKYSVRIPELAWEVQENVKNSVETMTGLNVKKVNIHIEGVSFEKDEEKKPATVANSDETEYDENDEDITD